MMRAISAYLSLLSRGLDIHFENKFTPKSDIRFSYMRMIAGFRRELDLSCYFHYRLTEMESEGGKGNIYFARNICT